MTARPTTALVLSGGGARGAYQAGALMGLRELGVLGTGQGPGFDILVGASAGALNCGMLAARADELSAGVTDLVSLWSNLSPSQVFRTDLRSLGQIGASWVRDLSFGGLTHRVAPKALLDASPLADLLHRRLPVDGIGRNVDSGLLQGLVVSAVDLLTANGVAFVDAAPGTPLWQRRRWSIERTRIGVEHLLASAAIPVFFPSVPIGGRWFGDGSVRNTNPLSPAIHLGADRVLTIGVRSLVPVPEPTGQGLSAAPTIAEIAGVLLDAVMLDAIEMDVAHSTRVNAGVLVCQADSPDYPFRHVDLLWLSPSTDVGAIAAELADRIPPIIRYLLRGLGSDQATTELASYLLFDSEYCRRLIALGRGDALTRRDDIREFFEA